MFADGVNTDNGVSSVTQELTLMADALSEFEWPVAAEYHTIEVAEGAENAWRSPVDFHPWTGKGRKATLIAPVGPSVRSIRPFTPEYAFLYREFAEMEVTAASALEFAKAYGLLGDTGADFVHPLWIEIPRFSFDGKTLTGEVVDAQFTDSW